mgnify:CR=1 FL=1
MGEVHECERQIMLKLIHAPQATFNELWAKQGESNTFAYHLHKLEEAGIVIKNADGAYHLTEKGRKDSAFIEGDTGARAEFPTLSVVMLVQDGDNWLCQRRLKQPFFGYWGFISGKINFGFNVFECATRDLEEETGLIATDWELKAIEQVKTFEDGRLLHHHFLFHVYTTKFSGVLKPATHKASNAWMTLDEYKSKETFPSEKFFEHIIPTKKPVMLEAERFMEAGKFVGMKTTRVVHF